MFENKIQKINKNLSVLLDIVNRRYRLRKISDVLFDSSKEFVMRPGKRIRPLLLVLSYESYTQRKNFDKTPLYRSAASIELLHDFMLIHDDVIDNSNLRRGKPTLHRILDKKIPTRSKEKIGKHLALVAGDVLFSVGIEAFLSINEKPERKEAALRKLVQTAAYTGAGEFIDVVNGHKRIDEVQEKEIFLTYILKTARYTFECPLVMGGLLAGAPSPEIKKLSRLGLAVGQAFQIYDDFLDLFASEEVIGKPVLSDLNESKKTLPLRRAFDKLPASGRARMLAILNKKKKTLQDLRLIRTMIVDTGAYDDCQKIIKKLQDQACALTESLKIKEARRKLLESLILKLSPCRMPLGAEKT